MLTIFKRRYIRRQRWAYAACSIALALLVTALIASAWGMEPSPGEEKFEALAKRFKTEQARFYAEAEKVLEHDPANTMFKEFLKLEEQHRGSLVGLSSLHHLVSIAFGGYGGAPEFPVTDGGRQALERLAVHYGDHPDLDTFFFWLSAGSSGEQAKMLLRRALKSPHRHIRGTALLALADITKSEAQVPLRINSSLELISEEPEKFPTESKIWARLKTHFANVDPQASHREALRLLDQVTVEYGDVLEAPRTTYGPALLKVERLGVDTLTKIKRRPLVGLAESMRVELTSLGIGQQAPEIAGADAFGNDLKLSNQRGKVVMLFFSFKGCGPCEAMYPDNRKLVETYQGRPFSLVGVMGDQELATVKEAVEEKKITWPVWWDGGGTKGPLATRWNVRGWPEIYVLDHRGVIRYREIRGEVLARAVAKLVEAAEQSR